MSHQAHMNTILTMEDIIDYSIVDKNGCWIWQKSFNRQYPSFGKSGHVIVHRHAWELKNGREMTDEFLACHSCNNKACVNPDHIYEGMHLSNIEDQYKAGRVQICHTQKLTDEQVFEIKKELATGQYGLTRKLSRLYGVSHTTICKIKKGLRFKGA